MKRLVSTILALALFGCAGNPKPNPTPTTPDPVLKAATEAGAIVSAVQAGVNVFFASGQSNVRPADQAAVNKVFADVSQAVVTAINTYSSAQTAANKQALANAIVNGVNQLVLQFAKFTPAQKQQYTAWVQTAVTLIDLVVPVSAGTGGSVLPTRLALVQ